MAIVDLLDNCQLPDFGPFKETFINNGIDCEICDIRDLRFDGNNLTTKEGKKIDAVYKRITLDDLLPFKDSEGVVALIDAALNDKVCPIDWFNSQIVHDKQLFAVLHMTQTQKLLNESEKEFIRLHIPETKFLSKDLEDLKTYIDNKDNYLVKPISSRDAQNVFVGYEMSQKEWENKIEKCAKVETYIIQKFATMHNSPNVVIDIRDKKGSIDKGIQQCCNMEGLYCYNSHFGGIYLRQRRSE